MELSSEQQEELRRLSRYYPYRVVFGVVYNNTGKFEAWAKPTRHAANRLAWDEAAEDYERRLAGSIALLAGGGHSLLPVETALLGDLRGCGRAVHLQCAGGEDTLSLWRLGAAEVVGIDFSPRMLALADRLGAAVRAPARWIEADVSRLPGALDGTADLVFSGRGSIRGLAWRTWLASRRGCCRCLKPCDRSPLPEQRC